MNYIKHLTGFFDRVVPDDRLNPTHISHYLSLFQYWNLNRFQNPISICRDEVMKVSKIAAKATYHKCMRDLNNFGYVQYLPSYNPFKGSLVHIVTLDLDHEPVQQSNGYDTKNQSADRTGSGTGTEQALVPSINNINIYKQDLVQPKSQHQPVQNLNPSDKDYFELIELPVQEQKTRSRKTIPFSPPTLNEIIEIFKNENLNEIEASKFFYHFESNGWKIGGRAPMKDWKAAARNWMLNIPKFAAGKKPTPAAPPKLNPNKNYHEPL